MFIAKNAKCWTNVALIIYKKNPHLAVAVFTFLSAFKALEKALFGELIGSIVGRPDCL